MAMNEQKVLRETLLELLEGKSAHIDMETAIRGFPMNLINDKPDGAPNSAWELLEHIRIAQWDILEFSRNAEHTSPEFPDGYWNRSAATALDWEQSSEQIFSDLHEMRELVSDESVDLTAKIPHGDGQTILREVLVLADHNAYHVGQMMLLKRVFEAGNC
jgi:succinylglutamate desuccinylase